MAISPLTLPQLLLALHLLPLLKLHLLLPKLHLLLPKLHLLLPKLLLLPVKLLLLLLRLLHLLRMQLHLLPANNFVKHHSQKKERFGVPFCFDHCRFGVVQNG